MRLVRIIIEQKSVIFIDLQKKHYAENIPTMNLNKKRVIENFISIFKNEKKHSNIQYMKYQWQPVQKASQFYIFKVIYH